MKNLIQELRNFSKERDWEQFHSPKNLVMALSVEVSELVEHFQWLTQEESRNLNTDQLKAIKDEIADIMIFLTMIADKFGIDVLEAAREKVKINEKKYPVEKSKGISLKYTEL